MTIKVKAIFKGKNGSMGFITGKEYVLHLRKHSDGEFSVNDLINIGWCDYSNFISFLKNWSNVSIIEESK